MSNAQHLATAASTRGVPAGSLRSEIERRRSAGETFKLEEIVAIMVPLCTEIAERHKRGERFFVYPSVILLTNGRFPQIAIDLAATAPSSTRDRTCLAPEERHGKAGDARASVFSVGAMIYELLTGETVGPGMRRPSQVAPGTPPAMETLLGKALVTDRAHRPDDLGALAQAIHHLSPRASIPPPDADESHLDQGEEFEVDVALSMLPPVQKASAPLMESNSSPDPYAMAVLKAPPPALRRDDPTAKLADLKARLESDPRPRYVVIKDGMDHGPFSAVELLQQIASHTFAASHVLRDTFSGEDRPIGEWDEFAPFAEQSKLHRDIKEEKQAIERVVVAEAKGTRYKTFVGLGAIAAILGVLAFWYVKVRGARNDAIEIAGDDGINVDTAGGLKGQERKKGARIGTGPGGIPILAGGMSCEQARARYIEEINIGGAKGQADLTAGQFGAILNNGSYIGACGTPGSMHVTVCAAVQNGRAVGVTVTTEPPNAGIANCISSAVRRMSFPSNPKLDVATTRF
jgi:eukaryotic-like serine/threonine-protein kinase